MTGARAVHAGPRLRFFRYRKATVEGHQRSASADLTRPGRNLKPFTTLSTPALCASGNCNKPFQAERAGYLVLVPPQGAGLTFGGLEMTSAFEPRVRIDDAFGLG